MLWKWLCYPVSFQHLGFIAVLNSALKMVSIKLFYKNATNTVFIFAWRDNHKLFVEIQPLPEVCMQADMTLAGVTHALISELEEDNL